MTNIQMEIRVFVHDNVIESIESVKGEFASFHMDCKILSKPVSFSSLPITIKTSSDNTRVSKYYSISVSGDIDVDMNRELDEVTDFDGNYLNSVFELYFEEIEPILASYVLALVLAHPDIEIGPCHTVVYLNNDVFQSRRYFDENCILTDAVRTNNSLIKEHIHVQQAWDWIAKNSTLFGMEKTNPPAFAALSYVLNREYPEILLYSIIGLESVFSPEDKGVNNILQNRITHVFPEITKDDIKKMYKLRSDFVHGNTSIGVLCSIQDLIDHDHNYEHYAKLSTVLLIETIRQLIANNAVGMEFKQTISHIFK